MNEKNYFADAARKSARLLTLMASILLGLIANATSYVTFNDGRLLVFPDECVQSMTQDDGNLNIIALDGSVYSYPMEDIESISEELTKELPTITSYKFNNKYNYQVFTDATGVIDGDTILVEVAGIGKRLTASFSLSDDNAVAYVDGVLQESKVSRMRFEGSKIYTVCNAGDMVLKPLDTGAYGLVPFGRDYVVEVDFLTDHSTSVPRIDINTVGGVNITSKKVYVDAEIIIDGAGVFPSMTDSVQIKGRGNSSWSTNPDAKNPYRLKFASKVKPFGMTKGKNWVLLANKKSGAQMTNAVGMKAASLMGTVAANHIVPVDLYLNGTYKGSYNFTEKVGLAGNSVDLDDETVATLLELDSYYDEPITQKFRSESFNSPVQIKDPEFGEDETLLTLPMIQERYNRFEAAVKGDGDFFDYVDVDALVRYMMVNDFICNGEIMHPKSVFLYNENILDESSKFIFGPVWDLDWAYGYNGTHASTFFNKNITFDFFASSNGLFSTMFKDRRLKQHMYELWLEFMSDGIDELCEYYMDYYNYAYPSIENNKNAGLDAFDYNRQVKIYNSWLRQRAAFIVGLLEQQLFVPGDVDGDGVVTIADVSVLVDYLLNGDDSIIMENADADGDGEVAISDVSALVDMLLAL